MNVQVTVKAQAADAKQGMTLDELGAFIQQAMREGLDGRTVVRIDSTWRSSIKRAQVSGPSTCECCGSMANDCVLKEGS